LSSSRSPLKAILPLAAVMIAGCASSSVEPLMPTPVLFSELGIGPLDHIPREQRWKPRRVFYATTREREGDLRRIAYGNAESENISVGLALIGFGGPNISWSDLNEYSRRADRPEMVDLSIAGLIEAGRLVPDDDAAAVSDAPDTAAWFMAQIRESISSARDRDLMVYVHGANVNFYNAAAFAAQLDHFMGRDMTSLAFSWPVRQNILAYGTRGDLRRAYRSADALASLLELLGRESGARRIHIVCWSAGGRVVNSALQTLHARHADTGEGLRQRLRIGTVYFGAADVPGDEFLEALPALNSLAHRIVVTVSSNDGALKMSQLFMGGSRRIGLPKRDLGAEQMDVVLAADRLEVVDVSRGWEGRGFDIDGHSYWINHPWASSDMILTVRSDLAPAERALQPTELDLLWGIPADYPRRLRQSLTRADLEIRRPPR